jgi:hypothetical protein
MPTRPDIYVDIPLPATLPLAQQTERELRLSVLELYRHSYIPRSQFMQLYGYSNNVPPYIPAINIDNPLEQLEHINVSFTIDLTEAPPQSEPASPPRMRHAWLFVGEE